MSSTLKPKNPMDFYNNISELKTDADTIYNLSSKLLNEIYDYEVIINLWPFDKKVKNEMKYFEDKYREINFGGFIVKATAFHSSATGRDKIEEEIDNCRNLKCALRNELTKIKNDYNNKRNFAFAYSSWVLTFLGLVSSTIGLIKPIFGILVAIISIPVAGFWLANKKFILLRVMIALIIIIILVLSIHY
jgi:hypothetical protein